MKMIRDTVEAEQTTAFQFDVKGCEFLILNFTGSDIYVSFGEEEDQEDMMRIGADNWRQHTCRTDDCKYRSVDTVYVLGGDGADGEVEIECLKW